ncbi:hypothetical protein [Jejuia spongiicola]|uniref:Uncharacterized protein n=1 Tax=Jejuia spongiicola TaxID=2942207 RepID=A0ABT0QH93_9FLAO|nr:hypothetical protein [Jejuia spongiicola]MCL6296361.1 hypothetical protein [Jejuia spongiicola]
MNNKFKLKYIEQLGEVTEAWIGSDGNYWVRLDFLLEYFVSNNVILSQKYKGKLDDFCLAKEYYESLFYKFMANTSKGDKFNFDEYLDWQITSKDEVVSAIDNVFKS